MKNINLAKQPLDIANMFDKVALKYDKTNNILSFAQAKRWRKVVTDTVVATGAKTVLDVAAGTGSSSAPFVAAGMSVVACDFSEGMLAVGRQRYPEIDFVTADATNLPFADNSFDSVTISFGLRNVAEIEKVLSEMLRVAKPGGSLVVAEFSHPTLKIWHKLYMNYLMKLLPFIAKLVSSNPQSYQYLAESIRQWPSQQDLAKILCKTGWFKVKYCNLSGGIVALHCGTKM